MSRKPLSLQNNPLFGGPSLSERSLSGPPFRLIPLSDIDVDPDQPRTVFDEQKLSELASSIKEYGVLTPILVRPLEGGTYRLISGERRLRASRSVGLSEIPAMIDSEESGDAEILAKQLVENLQRQDLGPLEKSQAIGILKDRFSLSVREIAEKLGVSKSSVQRSIDVLSLPDDLLDLLSKGVAESKVLLISKLENQQDREKLSSVAAEITRKALDKLVAECLESEPSLSHGGTVGSETDRKTPEFSKDSVLVEELQKSLGTKVSLNRKNKDPETGKLVLDFYSDDDLQDIYERLLAD